MKHDSVDEVSECAIGPYLRVAETCIHSKQAITFPYIAKFNFFYSNEKQQFIVQQMDFHAPNKTKANLLH